MSNPSRVGTPLARGDKLPQVRRDRQQNRGHRILLVAFCRSTNDETLLVIHSPQLAKHFTREMDRMWRGAELGITNRMRRKLERQQALCGSGRERD